MDLDAPIPPSPGDSLRETFNEFVTDKILFYFVAIGLALGMFIVAWLNYFFPIKYNPYIHTIIAAVIILFSLHRIYKNIKKARNIKKGLEGEFAAAYALEFIIRGGGYVFHDIKVTIGEHTFNIDHIAIAPQGIFTIETKNWGDEAWNLFLEKNNKKVIPLINQCFRQSDWLGKLLHGKTSQEISVRPILTFVTKYIQKEVTQAAHNRGVLLLAVTALQGYLTAMPVVLSREQIEEIKGILISYMDNEMQQITQNLKVSE